MTADLGPASATAPSFGPLLRRMRQAREATVPHWRGNRWHLVTSTLSQNELARRAGVDVAAVHRHEAGTLHPTRGTVLRLAEALELGDAERAALLVAAGYWPWPDLDTDRTSIVLAVALGVVAGDWRRLERAQ